MYCPKCSRSNAADAANCANCGQATDYFRERLFLGQQFVFVRAEVQQPIALKVDDTIRVYETPTILARHQHRFDFGDEAVRSGSGKLHVSVHDMYDADKIGTTPGIEIQVA